jgi:formate dehydrogenase subunit gamma
MAALLGPVRLFVIALAMQVTAAFFSPVNAQEPTQVNPAASSIKEDQLLKEHNLIKGRGTIPDTKSYVLEQPAGRDWRYFHEVTLRWIGAIAMVGMLALLVLFYLVRGQVRLEAGRSGRTLVRFNAFERFVHWMTAASFIILALTGLNITFGKELLLPYIGPDAFATLSRYAKYAHNFLSFPFTLGVVLIFLMWIAWAIPSALDVRWLQAGGGMVGGHHPPAGRLNAGQKIVYWIVVLGGGAVATSGYFLIFPFYATDIAGMQAAQMVHAVVAVLFVAIMLAHIYIGTIGMEGAFDGMWKGEVDVNWAQQHHSLWLEEERARGHVKPPSAPEGRVAPAE